MKKSKKALLWTIVPVLGVSSGVAGAIAGVTSQKTSVDTNNVATSSTATTMATSKSTSSFKIAQQTREVLTYSDLVISETLFVQVTGAPKFSVLKYQWYVNRNDNKGWILHTSTDKPAMIVDVQKGITTMQNWTFRCVVKDTKSSAQVTSEDIKFTIAPKQGRLIEITQPVASKTVNGGETVTLTTSAKGLGEYKGKEISYQWFEYDSENDRFTKIEDATSNSYTFEAPYYTTKHTKKYVCRYYIKGQRSNAYLSESNQSIITINKSEKEQVTFDKLDVSSKSASVGEKIVLSAEATSTKSKELGYQWYKLESDGRTFKEIDGANTKSYSYEVKASDVGKKLTFMVMVSGIVQDDLQNYFQSNNLVVEVKDSSQTTGTTTNEELASTLKITSSITTNQASVRSTFYAIGGIKTPTYSVVVEGANELTYQWYYVGQNNKEYSISGATSSTLATNKSLYEAAYKDNSSHKVGIKCKIYDKNGQLVGTVDQKTNSSFYMTVVITRR